MRYPARRDPGTIAALATTGVLGVVGAGAAVSSRLNLPAAVLLGAVCLGAGAFAVSLLVWTRYELTECTLEVWHGPFRWSIPLAEVRAVRPVRNLAAGAALARRRLGIRYGDGFAEIFIAPAHEDEFVRALLARAPHLGDTAATDLADAAPGLRQGTPS